MSGRFARSFCSIGGHLPCNDGCGILFKVAAGRRIPAASSASLHLYPGPTRAGHSSGRLDAEKETTLPRCHPKAAESPAKPGTPIEGSEDEGVGGKGTRQPGYWDADRKAKGEAGSKPDSACRSCANERAEGIQHREKACKCTTRYTHSIVSCARRAWRFV